MKLLIWLIYPVAEAVIQAYLIDKKNWKPIYFQLFVIRAFFAILFGGGVLDLQYDLVETLVLVFWCATSFFVVFNPLLNILRGKEWDYRGKTSGWIDRTLLNKDLAFHTFYALCVCLAVVSFMIGFKYF